MRKPRPADADAIFARLVTRNEQLDRQLAIFLEGRGLTPAALDLAAARCRGGGERLDAARERMVEELAASAAKDAAASWDAVTRPSVGEVAAASRGRLLRV